MGFMLINDLSNFIISKICLELKEKKDLFFLSQTCKKFYKIIFKQDPYAKIIWKPHQVHCLNALQYDISILKKLETKLNFSITDATITEIVELIKFTKAWKKYRELGFTFKDRNKKAYSFFSKVFSIFTKKSNPSIYNWVKKEKLLEMEVLENDGRRFYEIILSKNNQKLFQEIKEKPIENLCFKVGARCKTLLIMSVESKNTEVLKFLIKNQGTDINFCNGYATALMIAVYNNDLDAMNTLLGCEQLDANRRTKLGYVALHFAIIWGNKNMVDLLLQIKNIDVNIKGQGISSLMLAICRKALGVVKVLLVDKNLDINLKDDYGKTALFYAIDTGDSEVVQLILGHKDVDIKIRDFEGRTAVRYLLDKAIKEPHLRNMLLLFFEFYKKKFNPNVIEELEF